MRIKLEDVILDKMSQEYNKYCTILLVVST